MSKPKLIDSVWEQTRNHPEHEHLKKKDITKCIELAFDEIIFTLKAEEKFSYPGLGTLKLHNRAGRKGRNPATGEEIYIEPKTTVKFKPTKSLENSLN